MLPCAGRSDAGTYSLIAEGVLIPIMPLSFRLDLFLSLVISIDNQEHG